MRTGKSLVVLDVAPRRGRRKRSASLLLALAGALAALLSVGALMLLSAPGQLLAVLGRDAPSGTPEIAIAPIVFAQPWMETPFPIHVTPPGAERIGFIQIDGLPALALLSEGHATRSTSSQRSG